MEVPNLQNLVTPWVGEEVYDTEDARRAEENRFHLPTLAIQV